MPDHLGALRDYGVSEGSQSVHPMGNPIIHSTNRGDRGPLPEAIPASRRCPAHFAMLGESALRRVVGVGSIPRLAIVSRLGRSAPSLPTIPPRLLPYAVTEGVGNNEDPSPEMRSADIRRRQRNR